MNFYKSIHDGNWEIPPFSPFEPRECETSCEILAVRLIVSGFTDGRKLVTTQMDCGRIGMVRTDSVEEDSTLIKTILERIIIHELRNQNILIYSITLKRIS